ncbi:hypothetical protein [Archaeoglobus neptunius]|uniref:hypothetical protein n=1 Tax=Archaeoglobus neptunius TaxID=2798580 RepID=UPI0019255249|nr:hypothetical protein [Archaeoglobus neptunius]
MKLSKVVVCGLVVLLGVSVCSARDVLEVNADNYRWSYMYSGETDYFYCSWSYLSGEPHDAWKVQIPLYYVQVLDHWDGGSMWTEPGYYTWFIVDDVESGDSSPYDSYNDLPAPWIKVKYDVDSERTVTYECRASLWDRVIDVWGIPLYWKVVEEKDSFTITIAPKGFGVKHLDVEKQTKSVRNYEPLTPLVKTIGRMMAINALINNAEKLKDVDALTIEYSNGAWIVKGYRMEGKAFTEEVFRFKYETT